MSSEGTTRKWAVGNEVFVRQSVTVGSQLSEKDNHSTYVFMYVYIYIYICIYTHLLLFIKQYFKHTEK